MQKTCRTACLMLVFMLIASTSFSQTLDGFFSDKGVYDLSQAAHPANDFLKGTYDINRGYVDVSIKSRDNVFGATIHTDVRLVRGIGNLFFSDIYYIKDDDMVVPFEAFGLQAGLMTAMYKAVDQETYDKMRRLVKEKFHTDFEHWTGKMWALLAINLDYYEYMLKGQ